MQSRRDQVQAHLFMMGRLATGMLRGEPDAPDTPVGRTSRGTAAGIILGVVICLGIGAFGFISPGGATGWQKAGTLVEVKETGARYLFLAGELHPVLNEASARLISGAQMTVSQVFEGSLSGTPRGTPVGIVGAPDSLPSASQLTTDPWLACATSTSSSGGATRAGVSSGGIMLAVGPVDRGAPVLDGDGVLAVTSSGDEYLLWQGRRFRMPDAGIAAQALGYAAAIPVPVTSDLLDILPEGPDLTAPAVAAMGAPGPVLAGQSTRLGQLFRGPSNDPYLLTAQGLLPLTPTLFDLVRGDPRVQRLAYAGGPVTVVDIGPADLADHSAPSAAAIGTRDLPSSPPTLVPVPTGQSVCADLELSERGSPAISLSLAAPLLSGASSPQAMPGITPGCGNLNAVSVPPDAGAWVRALSAAGSGSTTYLITDGGVKYPVPTEQAATQLGYSTATPVAVPQSLLDLLPTGPSLDPAALVASGGVVGPVAGPPVCPAYATASAGSHGE